ncbi:MAG: class I SAM-dependent methyltransferase [Acidobacteria bacterium]|nr:class I SAM-dependent methyltransferase [Acidobacteriota bacterium]
MSVGGWLFACAYDRLLSGVEAAGLQAHRKRLLASASGRVLEIGAGTGANLTLYPEGIESLTVTEPESAMARKLARRIRDERRTAALIEAPAEQLPFGNAEFDAVVSTLVLCTVKDQAQVLGEIRRVLKPSGCLLFIEHVRSDEPQLARWQDRLNGLNRIVGHGCNCNRRTLEAIGAAGFRLTSLERTVLHKAPPFVRPLVVGIAESGVRPLGGLGS